MMNIQTFNQMQMDLKFLKSSPVVDLRLETDYFFSFYPYVNQQFLFTEDIFRSSTDTFIPQLHYKGTNAIVSCLLLKWIFRSVLFAIKY